jgi:hypothetical protein
MRRKEMDQSEVIQLIREPSCKPSAQKLILPHGPAYKRRKEINQRRSDSVTT